MDMRYSNVAMYLQNHDIYIDPYSSKYNIHLQMWSSVASEAGSIIQYEP